ncbi:MAG TPA: DNA polymerase Y family protein [Polyangiaceae bacterium]|jgi:protein ImuB
MRRVACVALPEIRVEIAREAEAAPVLAVVVARAGGAVKTERDVLGNTRLDVVSAEARAAGIRVGQTVAAARAKHGELRVRVVAEDAVAGALARVAEVALAFGPVVGFDAADDVVWVDVGGCAHLHGGEEELARALEARVRDVGHACRVAVADGPRIASAVARFGAARAGTPHRVPPGEGAAAMRALPVAALALDDDATRWLVDLGLRRCGHLQELPRRALGTRLGARAHDVMQLLDGEDRAPFTAWRPPVLPEERVELEWGAESTEALAFVTKALCDRMAARLRGRAMAAARLELVLGLDRALCDGADPVNLLAVVLPSPLAAAADLLAVVRTRLERHVLTAPVLRVSLRATELAAAEGRTLGLLDPEPRADRVLPRLVAELSADLGAARVGVLSLVDRWSPDERTRLVPYGASPPSPRHPLTTSALEPTRLVVPRPVGRGALRELHVLARYEAVEWWRRGHQRRDVASAWVGAGEGALGWLELRDDEDLLRGWFD